MHQTLEGVQQSATPSIRGPLQLYVVLGALALAITAPTRLGRAITTVLFLGLTVDAVGLKPLRWLGVPVLFLAPGLLVVLVTIPGETVAQWGPLVVTDAGIGTAAETGTRSLATLSILVFLVASTPISTVISTLRRWGLPPVLVELFLYVYRAIASIMVEAERMRTAAKARVGFRNRRVALRTWKLLVGALFVRTIDRVKRLDESMRARCYAGEPPAKAEVESEGYPVAIGVLAVLVGVHLL